jgi:hypothetical protein
MNWGKSIIAAFIFFAVFIAALVSVCMRQEVSLVSNQYYKEDLQYQQELESLNNASALASKPAITLTNSAVVIEYANWQRVSSGKLSIQRPSDESLDKQYALESLSSSQVTVAMDRMPAGLYKLKFEWQENGVRFSIHKTIVV